jgi:hypothetical protein
MQTIQRRGNLNFITTHNAETQMYPFPDISVNRQCVDFQKLTELRKDNRLDLGKYVEKMKNREGGVRELHPPDDYYKYFQPNITNPNHVNAANPGEDFNLWSKFKR